MWPGHSDGDGSGAVAKGVVVAALVVLIAAALLALVTLVVVGLVAFVVLALVIILVGAAAHGPCVCMKYMVSTYILAILLTFKNNGYSPKYEPMISF